MKAVMVSKDNQLLWTDVPDPVCGPEDILIRICAAALNRADIMQRAGQYPPPPGAPEWMGLEVAGVVEKMGSIAEQKSSLHIGSQVCALLGGGGYAQYVAVRWDMAMPIPKGLSLIEAAALPEAFATAYLNLFVEAGLKSGDCLLMNAGASGLASVVIPMAKAFGIRVITTVLTDELRERIAHLNADLVVNTTKESIVDVLRNEAEAGRPISAAIDCLGGTMVGECLPYMSKGGRWIIIATLAGDTANIDMRKLYTTGARLIGSTLRSRSLDMKAHLLQCLVEKVWPKIEEGAIRPTICGVFPIEQAEAAQQLLNDPSHVGKVVMKVSEA